jgi:hypothetical protein
MTWSKSRYVIAGLMVLSVLAGVSVAIWTHEGEKPHQIQPDDAKYAKSKADASLMWSATPEQDRAQICRDLDAHGWDWTRDQLSKGAPAQSRDATNWDTVVAYIVERCGERR